MSNALSGASAPPLPRPVVLWGLITLMTLFWAVNPVAGKIALRHFPETLLIGLRTIIAASLMAPAFLLWEKRKKAIERRDWAPLLALGLFGLIGNQTLFVIGLNRTSVAHSAFIYSTLPVTILVFAAAIGQERLAAAKLLGMAIAIGGVMLLTADKPHGRAATLAGDLLTIAATLAFAAFTVFGKARRARYGPLTVTAVAYCSGALVFAPLVGSLAKDFRFADVPAEGWVALLYMAAFSAVVSYLIYFWALAYAPASRIAALQYMQPPVATGLGVVLLGEPITPTLLVGGAVILAGVFLVEKG